MADLISFDEVVADYFNQEKPLQKSAADLGAIILEIKHEEESYGNNTKRMAKLKALAVVQEQVVLKMMENCIGNTSRQKVPHLQLLKY